MQIELNLETCIKYKDHFTHYRAQIVIDTSECDFVPAREPLAQWIKERIESLDEADHNRLVGELFAGLTCEYDDEAEPTNLVSTINSEAVSWGNDEEHIGLHQAMQFIHLVHLNQSHGHILPTQRQHQRIDDQISDDLVYFHSKYASQTLDIAKEKWGWGVEHYSILGYHEAVKAKKLFDSPGIEHGINKYKEHVWVYQKQGTHPPDWSHIESGTDEDLVRQIDHYITEQYAEFPELGTPTIRE